MKAKPEERGQLCPPDLSAAGVRPTKLIDSKALSDRLGVKVLLASETEQYTGSFKFRAAHNVAAKVPNKQIIAASSGNYGQALAAACRLVGKSCTIVMPENSARIKIEAVRRYGGTIEFVDTRVKSRLARVLELAAVNPDAYLSSAYDDPLVIEGNASLGRELAECADRFDCVLAPVGGGGLTAGIITGLRERRCTKPVWAVEPIMANDAARSLREGRIIAHTTEPQTIADGVRTVSLGKHNWAVLRDGLAGVIEVSETNIIDAVRILFRHAKLKAEPTGALPVAALLEAPRKFRGQIVCCVISGGNVDPDTFENIAGQETDTPADV
jgi:threonine dehydratase